MRICIALLAAGGSSRFGANKLNSSLDGVKVIDLVVENIKKLFVEDVVVIVNNRWEYNFPDKWNVIENPQWRKGISTSVKLAVSYAKKHNYEGILFFLADMPFVDSECTAAVLEHIEYGVDAVYPVYKGKKCFPTYISKKFFEKAKSLEGDEGFKRLLGDTEKFTIIKVPIDYEKCCFDIDTPADFEKAKRMLR